MDWSEDGNGKRDGIYTYTQLSGLFGVGFAFGNRQNIARRLLGTDGQGGIIWAAAAGAALSFSFSVWQFMMLSLAVWRGLLVASSLVVHGGVHWNEYMI